MGNRKDQLLDSVIDYLTRNGIADLSLRPLSAAIGSSARLLIFHFKSKDNLVIEVLGKIQQRLMTSLQSLELTVRGAGQPSPMRAFWNWATDESNLPYLRLLYEVHFMALQNPAAFGHYLDQTSVKWLEMIEDRLPPELRSKATATLCAAVFDGLVMELLSTGDRTRTTEALDTYIDMLADRYGRQVRSTGHRAASAGGGSRMGVRPTKKSTRRNS